MLKRMKCIEDNMVFLKDGKVWAYYEMNDYNYAFVSLEQKRRISDSLELLIGQSKNPTIHFLQIATESDFKAIQDKAKKEIGGNIKEFTTEMIDIQTDVLKEKFGEHQIKYRHYIGFCLNLADEEFKLKEKMKDVLQDIQNFLGAVRYHFMNDFLVMSKIEIERYRSVERMLFNKVSKKFRFEKVTPRECAYLIEHMYGMDGVAYEDYSYIGNKDTLADHVIYKKFDFLKLSASCMTEGKRCVEINRDEGKSYCAYYSVSTIVNDLIFPNSEILYYQQRDLNFPIDTSINIELVENKTAINFSRKKEMETDDLITHALKKNAEPSSDIIEANETAKELEVELKRTKSNMYKVSYLIRISGKTMEELERRCTEVRDFYDGFDVKLVRPSGNMIDLHGEFLLGGKRALNDYVQHVMSGFLSGLGFGATTKLGDDWGIYIGINLLSNEPVYVRPWLAAQGIKGAVTNALSAMFVGATGWGKSFFVNTLIYNLICYGRKVIILDPKSERGGWVDSFPELADEIKIINLTSDEHNRGVLDPFVVLTNKEEAGSLAIDILACLTGISMDDGEKMPYLMEAVKRVEKAERSGLLNVIQELRNMNEVTASRIANHIEGFSNYALAKLFFSDGTKNNDAFSFDKNLNILQVSDLILPDKDIPVSEYSATEKLSVLAMMVIGILGIEFMNSGEETFKVMAIDEAWAMLGNAYGKTLQSKFIRAGRSKNSGLYFITQGVDDVGNKDVKNNVGMKFAFHSDDEEEIKSVLSLFGLDENDEELHKMMRGLGQGEALFKDIRGNVGLIYIDPVFDKQAEGFNTKPRSKDGE